MVKKCYDIIQLTHSKTKVQIGWTYIAKIEEAGGQRNSLNGQKSQELTDEAEVYLPRDGRMI